MKVKNTVPLTDFRLLSCITDSVSLRLIGIKNSRAAIATLDPNTMGMMNGFSVETQPHEFYKSCIDDDCIYLPTKAGQVLGIDKFSGEISATSNIGLPIMSDIYSDEENIYFLCGVPIKTKWKLNVNNFCVTVCNKESGEKIVQTSYFQGPITSFALSDKCFWVNGQTKLYKYHKNGELQNTANLQTAPDYPILITDKYIILCYKNGVLRLFDKNDLSIVSEMKADSNISGGIIAGEESVAWVSKQGICHINYETKVFQTIKTKKQLLPFIILSPGKTQIFTHNTEGNLMSFGLENQSVQSIKLSTGQLSQMILIDNELFVNSGSTLHHLEVTG